MKKINPHTIRRIIPYCILLILYSNSFSQSSFMKFGKIPVEDLKMTVYEKDTNASAVILGEEGYATFNYSEDKGWRLLTKVHRRIKILKQTGMEWANGRIRLYESGINKEELSALRGFTYNLVNGKVVKEKMTNDAIFKEEVDDFTTLYKYTFPDVKPGSILEYSYSILSDFISQPDPWQFQYEIPVVESQFTIEIPEYFQYKEQSRGYEIFQKSQNYMERTFSFTYAAQFDPGANGGRTSGGVANIPLRVSIQNYHATNMPAFISEPDMNNISNYLTSIEFELMSFTPKYGLHKNFSNTWTSVKNTLIEHDNFGQQLKGTGFLGADADKINATSKNDLEKTIKAFELIKSKMSWNGYQRMYTKKNIRSAYTEGVGNSAEINLLLVALLRNLNLSANPVILSTRARGMIMPGQIMLSKFNYVIASVKLSNEIVLLDATDKQCPFNMLPERCLNGQGRIINEEFTDWVDLSNDQPYESVYYTKADLSDAGELTAEVQELHKAYAAYEKRYTISKESSVDEFISKFEQAKKNVDISEFEIIDKDSVDKPLTIKYNGDFSQLVTVAGDMIYLNPMLLGRKDSNPYKLEVRKYPVDYIYPRNTRYVINITIPENYTIMEIPKPVSYSLPEKTAIFSYTINKQGNIINIICDQKINKTIFAYNEYAALKQFYENIVAKHAEQVVLKKAD